MSTTAPGRGDLEIKFMDAAILDEGEMVPQVPVTRAPLPDRFKEFLCGGGAAFCNILISYPLNKLIFRQVQNFLVLLLVHQSPLLHKAGDKKHHCYLYK